MVEAGWFSLGQRKGKELNAALKLQLQLPGVKEWRSEGGGFQERRRGETRSRQTSEEKQKLMQQDVTADGSLHPSKPGTLAIWHASHVSPQHLPLRLPLAPFELEATLPSDGSLDSSLITLQAIPLTVQ